MPCNTWHDPQQSGHPVASAGRRRAGPAAAALAQWAPRAARLAAALAGLVAIGAYLFVALRRLDYPFALEWLEGNSLVEVHRILAGQPLYPAPTAGYVPDGYPPLYFAVSAAGGPRARRLVPAAAAGVPGCPRSPASRCSPAWSSGKRAASRPGPAPRACSPRPTSPRTPGSTSAGSTRCSSRSASAACTPPGGCAAPRGAVAAGVLLAAAALTKQTGLAEVVAVTAVAADRPAPQARLRRRADRGRGARRQHARARADQRRLVPLLRLQADERALADRQQLRLVLDGPGDRDGPGRVRRPDRRAPGAPRAARRAAPRWRSRATPPWCTAAAASTTCCPRTSPWRCSRAWRSAAASGPGGSPRCRACSSSPSRPSC